MELGAFNTLPTAETTALLLQACHSERWAAQLTVKRPFAALSELTTEAEHIWLSLGEADWLEAFAAHPKIGERKVTDATAAKEQSAVNSADQKTLSELATLNRQYLEKFGFIFIVCATGKSAPQMLQLLQQRLPNSRAQELKNAALEQAKITRLRLEKLF